MKALPDFIALAQSLSAENIDDFVLCYAHDAVFTDPFQTVRGRDAVRHVYQEMLQQLHLPRFHNVRTLGAAMPQAGMAGTNPGELILGWDFEFAVSPGKPRVTIAGCSLLRFNDRGEITEHRDYWDASRLMEAFPVIGKVIGWLRQKIGQPSSP